MYVGGQYVLGSRVRLYFEVWPTAKSGSVSTSVTREVVREESLWLETDRLVVAASADKQFGAARMSLARVETSVMNMGITCHLPPMYEPYR